MVVPVSITTRIEHPPPLRVLGSIHVRIRWKYVEWHAVIAYMESDVWRPGKIPYLVP